MALKFFSQKLGMHQYRTKSGKVVAVTVFYCFNSIVHKFKALNNIVLKTNTQSKKKMFAKNIFFNVFYEYKSSNNLFINYSLNDVLNLSLLSKNQTVKIKNRKIGKGTMGNIKKNNFKRGPESHGSKHHRLQGSLGAGTSPGRVFPGKKMSGRSTSRFATSSNLTVLEVIPKYNTFVVKGPTPGKATTLAELIFHPND